jgi:hypothetical protein
MSIQYLKNAVMSATQSFINNDADLLQLKVYELSVSHRVAFYLERDFFNKICHVDCEYDKRFDLNKPGPGGTLMRPDILVHTRNQSTNNKIAIEIKKTRTSKYDVEKLKMLTQINGLYKYDLGVFVRFPKDQPIYRWFVNGDEVI